MYLVKKFKNLTNFYVYSKSYGNIILLFDKIESQKIRDKKCEQICHRFGKPVEPLKCKFERTNFTVYSLHFVFHCFIIKFYQGHLAIKCKNYERFTSVKNCILTDREKEADILNAMCSGLEK